MTAKKLQRATAINHELYDINTALSTPKDEREQISWVCHLFEVTFRHMNKEGANLLKEQCIDFLTKRKDELTKEFEAL